MNCNLFSICWISILVAITSSCLLLSFVVATDNVELHATAEAAAAAASTTIDDGDSPTLAPAVFATENNLQQRIHNQLIEPDFSNSNEKEKETSFFPNNDDDVRNAPENIIQVGDSQLHSEASSSVSMALQLEATNEQQHTTATSSEPQESQQKQKVRSSSSSSRNEGSIPIENEGDLLKVELHGINAEENMFDNQQWQQQQQQQHHITSEKIRMEGNPPIIATKESLPDMLENPPVITLNEVTSTELPVEIFEQHSVESVIISSSNSDVVNETIDLSDGAGISREDVQKDDQIQKINDSGGKIPPQPPDDILLTPLTGDNSVPTTNIPVPEQQQQQQQQNVSSSVFTSSTTTTTTADETVTSPEVNLTAEEIPIPVFSEWAQKQMEAAEKQLEQEVVNSSAQKKNATNGSKQSTNKLRTKNYASPDCGAKIIASNFDAQNTGALLTSSKDEYMLSPCTNRIWFVVELCEAIQAEKIDLANFELFSSSPKNFSVAVSNRFPTREWSNVGRFVADDKRNIQSFDLHPHLFGKFVRVDIHSHYNSEHFCPVSLFRVYGTSEFEAFETENRLIDDIDEYEDDAIAFDQAHIKNENNLFKSASDAVLSIVKKAAEALVKTNTNRSTTDVAHPTEPSCFTPVSGEFTCANCNSSLVSKINHILSCKHSQLIDLLNVNRLRNDIVASQICAKQFSIETQENENSFSIMMTTTSHFVINAKQSYFLNLLPSDYVGALCQLVAAPRYFLNTKTATDMPTMNKSSQMIHGDDEDIALNLTIDKKSNSGDSSSHFETFDNAKKAIGETNKLPVLSKEEEILKQHQDIKKPKDSIDSESSSSSSSFASSSILEPQHNKAQMPITPNNDDKLIPKESQIDDRDRLSLRRDDNTASKEDQFASSQSSQTIPSTLDVNIYNIPDTAGAAATVAASSSEIQTEQSINLPNSQDSSSKIEQQTNLDGGEGSGNNYEATTPPSEISSVHVSSGKTDDMPGQKISPEDSSSWESLDSLLSEPQQPTAPTITTNGNGNGNSYQYTKIASGAHSESVFIRLSNRIKALERNMSLSGQYLEELSRRYKKQVEELQQSLTKTVRALEDQNRRHSEQELHLMERNSQLRDEIDDLSLQVHACIVLIICVGATVFILFFVGILFYRAIRRQASNSTNSTIAPKRSPSQKSLNRRKSFEDFSGHKTASSKVRRPSEEAAVLILKDCNSEVLNDVAAASAGGGGGGGSGDLLHETKRQRKISVCYSNGLAKCTNAKRTNRKLDKKSRTSMDCINSNEYAAMLCVADDSTKITNCNGGVNVIRDKKKSLPISWYKQQCLSSGDNVLIQNHNNNNNNNSNTFCSFDEKAILDEDDSVNFLPGADLAYNEFMPDGPSGYTVINNSSNRSNVDPSNPSPSLQKSMSFDKKLRRLSSPAFFKSPFGKSNKSKTTPSHQSTSWEWYRLKKSDAHQKQQSNVAAIASDQSVINPRPSTASTTTTASSNGSNTAIVTGTGNIAASQNQLKLINGFGGANRLSPTAVTPESSSLSEILSLSGHNNGSGSSCVGGGGGGGGGDGSVGNENPFRILEEAIISSAASAESTVSTVSSILSTNGNCNSSGSGSAGSNRSSKKRRTFNKIFKKVF